MRPKIINPGKINQNVYSDQAHANKVAEAGLFWQVLSGDLSSAQQVPEQGPVLIYNSDTTVHFVAFGDASVSAPSDALSGIPIPPGQLFVLSSGFNEYVISDSNAVFGYIVPAEPIDYPATYPGPLGP